MRVLRKRRLSNARVCVSRRPVKPLCPFLGLKTFPKQSFQFKIRGVVQNVHNASLPGRDDMIIVPLLLTLLRLALAPIVVFLAIFHPLPWAFGVCLTLALISDIFDGVIARRFNVAKASLRRLDSIVDTTFYGTVIYAVWHLRPEVLLTHVGSLGVLVSLELTRYAIDFMKFRREAAYHMWSSKLWGLVLFLAFFATLVAGPAGILVPAAIYMGIFADVEGLMISFVLRRWEHDVPTIFHALRIRRAS